MSNKLVRIKNRYDTYENWYNENPVLAAGEIGITTDGLIKVGNGTSTWRNTLPLIGYQNTHMYEISASSEAETNMIIHQTSAPDNVPNYHFRGTTDFADNLFSVNKSTKSIYFILFMDGFSPAFSRCELGIFNSETTTKVDFNLLPLANSSIDYDNMPKFILNVARSSEPINIFNGFEIPKPILNIRYC